MRIAVVIPALNEADRIQHAIRSVGGSARPGDVEVLVVDGGSRDATRERARAFGARIVESEPGRARQLAAGAAATEADLILFLHADSKLPDGWVDDVTRALAEPAVVGGAFTLAFESARWPLRVIAWGARWRIRLGGVPYGDQGIFVRRRELAAIGGVPQVPLMEDRDLARALRRRGRLAILDAPVLTSPRRYAARGGAACGVVRNWLVLLADRLGVDRARIARWYRA